MPIRSIRTAASVTLSILLALTGCGSDEEASTPTPTPVASATPVPGDEGPGPLLSPDELDTVCFDAVIAFEVEASRDEYAALDADGRQSFEGVRKEAFDEIRSLLEGRAPADVLEALDLIIGHPITSDAAYDTAEHAAAVELARTYLGLSCPAGF